MRILIADDDYLMRTMLEKTLVKWDYDVEAVENGREAYDRLVQPNGPNIAILDWMMPEINGLEVCKKIKGNDKHNNIYLILLTTRTDMNDIIKGFDSGADDYLAKPFDPGELRARINVGCRVVELQKNLTERVCDLKEALDNIKNLTGMLPICAACKKIRDDKGYWNQIEVYITEHTEAEFTHGMCPECTKQWYPNYLKKQKSKNN